MKCEQCGEEGLTSRVYDRGGSRTMMGGGGTHWDEDGVKHYHDVNTTTQYYECTNKHIWQVKGRPECPAEACDYGGWGAPRRIERPKPPENTHTITMNGVLTFLQKADNVSDMTATALQNRQQ